MGFNEFQDGGNFLNSINDSVKVLLLEIRDSNLDIRENGFGISNAGVDILEALGVQSSVEDTSNNEFELGGSQVVDLCNLSLRFLSEDSLGSSLSNLKSEVVVVLGFIVMDSGLDFLKDIFSVDEEVLTNVVGEGGWTSEDGGHLFKLGPVSLEMRAVRHGGLDHLEHGSNFLDSVKNTGNISLLEVGDCSLGISEDTFSIGNALGDISETLSIESTLEDTSNNLLKFGGWDSNLVSLSFSEEGSEYEWFGVHVNVSKFE